MKISVTTFIVFVAAIAPLCAADTNSDAKSQALQRAAVAHAERHIEQGRLCAMELDLPDEPWVIKYRLDLKANKIEMLTAIKPVDDREAYQDAYNATMEKAIARKIGPSFVAGLKDRWEPYTKTVFIVDTSALMFQDMPFAIAELQRRIKALTRSTKFVVVFYQDGKAMLGGELSMFRATASHRKLFLQWLEKNAPLPKSNANPVAALRRAHQFEPDQIVWLSNGATAGRNAAVPLQVHYELDKMRRTHESKIHTVRILGGKRIDWMAKVSKRTGGKHMDLTAKALGIELPED